MPEIALHTVLKPGMERAYGETHANQPPAMTQTLRDAGVADWRIWRSGLHLFHLIEVRDWNAMNLHLAASAVNAEWDKTMSEFLDQPPDWKGAEAGISLVWRIQ